jgi:hypothetical protein
LTNPRACHEHSTHNKILHFARKKKKGKVKKKGSIGIGKGMSGKQMEREKNARLNNLT